MNLHGNRRIPLSEPVIGDIERKWINQCLDSGFVSSAGPLVSEFEDRFAEYVGSKYAIATSSGTAAIHAALTAAGIRNSDKVAVSDLTFVASMNPVLYCGASPVLVDAEVESWCMHAGLLERLCERLDQHRERLAAVIPVHLYGCACDMEAIRQISSKYGFSIIEDATEALGTRISGRHVGTFGDMGCFSFNGNKMITTGSGGMVVTDSSINAERIRHLVNQARSAASAYVHSEAGFNYRMNSLSAALGLAQMERMDEILAKKKKIAEKYRNAFYPVESIECHPSLPDVDNSYWLYSVLLNSRQARDTAIKALNEKSIEARKFFEPLHTQPYAESIESFPIAPETSEAISERGICLPSSYSMTDREQEQVISSLIKTVQDCSGETQTHTFASLSGIHARRKAS